MGGFAPSSPPTRRNRGGSGDLPLEGGGQDKLLTSPLEGEVAGVVLDSSGWGGKHPLLATIRALSWLFISLALLAAPLFAHGCHGDDIDHEPLLIPLRVNPEDQ
jgi:hypothetical protein